MPGALNGPALLLTTDAVGGVWRYTMDLARGLSARGEGCVVAVLGPGPDAGQAAEARGIAGLNLVRTGLPLDWTAEGPDELAHASGRLVALAALMGVRGVHLHAPALVGRVRWPVPVVVVGHSDVGTWWRAVRGDAAMPVDFGWRVAATGAGLRAAAAVIAQTAAHAAAMRAVYGDFGVEAVSNGGARVVATGERARAVLTAGRLWDEGKGVARLDEAAARIGAPVRAAGSLAGPNGAVAALRHMEALGVLDAAGMARAYSGATVFCSMARYEPFGLAVLEAASSGMRLVLADIPTFRELWDGVADFVEEDGDLVGALNGALAAGADGRAVERAGGYTVDRMVEGTLGVWRRVERAGAAKGAGGAWGQSPHPDLDALPASSPAGEGTGDVACV